MTGLHNAQHVSATYAEMKEKGTHEAPPSKSTGEEMSNVSNDVSASRRAKDAITLAVHNALPSTRRPLQAPSHLAARRCHRTVTRAGTGGEV
jgi:hypothetical protein